MKKLFFLLFVFVCVQINVQMPASAQAIQKPDSFSVRAQAIDSRTLGTNRYTVQLWGLESPDTLDKKTALRGRLSLDRLIANKSVQCHVVSWVKNIQALARCSVDGEGDLAQRMIASGFMTADRLILRGSDYEDIYIQAEQNAQSQALGLWKSVLKDDANQVEGAITSELFYGLLGLVVLLLFMVIWMAESGKRRHEKLTAYVKKSLAKFKARDDEMRQREKYVLAAMLQKEIQDNKDKAEAFIIINRDLLEGIKSAKAKTMLHRYQQSGEIIQKQPAFSRTTFDNNANRLDLLEPDIVQKVINLYADILDEPDYLTLDKEIPLHEAINHVQQTLLNTEEMLDPFDQIYSALEIIMDETKRRKIYQSAKAAAVSNV